MIRRKTVFIVGAGASAEAKLPIGYELKTKIAQMLSFEFEYGMRIGDKGDGKLFDMLRVQLGSEINVHLDACRQISRGLVNTNSIDDFIHNFQHDKAIALCGKVAIAKAIFDAEYNSVLHFSKTDLDSTINFNAVEDTWYSAFYNLLTQGVPRDDLESIFDNVTIVCFNYDRCIEHYLVHALINHYSIPYSHAIAIVEGLVIHRPYGSVGSFFDRSNAFPFGSRHYPSIQAITSSLKTYTENGIANTEPESMLATIDEAETLVFLGMAFHPNNMNLLYYRGDNYTKVPKQIYLTRCGIPQSALPMIYASLNRVLSSKPNDTRDVHIHHQLITHKCVDLFTEYGMLLRA